MRNTIWHGRRHFLKEKCSALFLGDVLILSDDQMEIDDSGEEMRTTFDLPRKQAVSLAKWILEQETEHD